MKPTRDYRDKLYSSVNYRPWVVEQVKHKEGDIVITGQGVVVVARPSGQALVASDRAASAGVSPVPASILRAGGAQ